MRRYLLSFILIATGLNGLTQQFHQVIFANGETISSFSFLTDQGVIIRISDDGKLLQWGMEQDNRRYNYIPGNLDPFMGRVDYYGNEADSISRGKVKNIGTCMFNYYGAFEQENKIGKIRSVGMVQLDYYNQYDNVAYKGKIRSANNVSFAWYSSNENESFRGKLKSVNNTPLSYYSSFDDKAIRGKVKSIGNINYAWYTSFDRTGYQGILKSGNYSQYVNGVTYIIGR